MADAAAFLAESTTSRRARWSVLVALRVPLAEAERLLPPGTGELTPVDDASCLLRRGSDAPAWLAVWVAPLGVDFEVHEPAELREFLRELGACPGRPVR